MTTFAIEAVALCVLFHLAIWSQVRQEPVRRVYSYHPAIVERYIELGKIPDKKNPSTLERVKNKWPIGDHAVYSRREIEPMLQNAGFTDISSKLITPFAYVSVGLSGKDRNT